MLNDFTSQAINAFSGLLHTVLPLALLRVSAH